MIFDNKTIEIAIKQFFGSDFCGWVAEQEFVDRSDIHYRWWTFGNHLIDNVTVSHLWENRNFRFAYQVVIDITNSLDEPNPEHDDTFTPWKFIEYHVREALQRCNHPVEAIEALIEGASFLLKDE